MPTVDYNEGQAAAEPKEHRVKGRQGTSSGLFLWVAGITASSARRKPVAAKAVPSRSKAERTEEQSEASLAAEKAAKAHEARLGTHIAKHRVLALPTRCLRSCAQSAVNPKIKLVCAAPDGCHGGEVLLDGHHEGV